MSYQDYVKRNIRRAGIRSVLLYTILALLSGLSALSFFTSGNSVELLDMLPIPANVSGTIFLIVFLFVTAVDLQAIWAAVQNKAYRQLLDGVKKFGAPDSVFAYVEQMPKSELCSLGDFRCDKKYTAYTRGDVAILQPTRNIVWGYLQGPSAKSDSRKHSEPKTNVPYNIVICFKTGDILTLRAKDKERAEKLLASIEELSPTMAVGYSSKLAALFKRDPEKVRKNL